MHDTIIAKQTGLDITTGQDPYYTDREQLKITKTHYVFANRLRRHRILSAWISGLLTSKI